MIKELSRNGFANSINDDKSSNTLSISILSMNLITLSVKQKSGANIHSFHTLPNIYEENKLIFSNRIINKLIYNVF